MKKIIILALAAVVAFSAAADESTVNLYGKFRLDYDLKKSSMDAEKRRFGGFNFDRARLGFKWTMSDDLSSKIEMDVHSYELRIAEVTWSASEVFDFTVGRTPEAYAPQSEEHGSRFDGISGAFDLGIAEFILQFGNARDTAETGTGLAIMPAVIIAPDMGNVSLETGLNARYVTEYTNYSTDLGVDATAAANLFAILEVSDLEALISVDFHNLLDSDTTNIYLNGDVNYTVSDVTLGSSVYLTDLYTKETGKDMRTDLDIYVSSELTDGFKVKATMGLDYLTKSIDTDELDYKFTLRFEWNPSYDF